MVTTSLQQKVHRHQQRETRVDLAIIMVRHIAIIIIHFLRATKNYFICTYIYQLDGTVSMATPLYADELGLGCFFIDEHYYMNVVCIMRMESYMDKFDKYECGTSMCIFRDGGTGTKLSTAPPPHKLY